MSSSVKQGFALDYQDAPAGERTMTAPRAVERHSKRRTFIAGALCTLAVLFAVRFAINETTVPDRLVSPLFVADTPGSADAIVVLGASVVGNCVPNLNGVWRVMLGVRLWREGRAPVVVMTGGTGEPCPVAIAMARFARQMGVPESSIIVEATSRSTKENADRSAPLLDEIGARRVLLVTDRQHMRRSEAVFAHLGFAVERASVPVYQGHVDNMSLLSASIRETAALAYYGVRGWLSPSPERAAIAPADAEGTLTGGSVQQTDIRYPDGPIVVLGASYARGWTPAAIGRHRLINKGAGGQQSFEMLERFERDVVAENPRAVILWGFINDIFRGSPEEIEQTAARTRESFTKMVELARANGIEPILATEVTMGSSGSWSETFRSWVNWVRGKESYQAYVNRHVMDINRWLADFASREGLLLVDLHGALADEEGRRKPEFTLEDGSHLTEAAYGALTTHALPVLEKHFADGRSGS